MEVEEAKKLLDQLTMDIHELLNRFKDSTGVGVRKIELVRSDITGLHDVRPRDRLVAVQMEAEL